VSGLFTLLDRFAPYPHKYQEYLLTSFFLLSSAQSLRLFPTLDIVLQVHSFVSSQDTSDRPFNSGFDIERPTKYKDTNRCKDHTYFNEQPFGIYLRKVKSFSSNVCGLISTITAHGKYFNIARI